MRFHGEEEIKELNSKFKEISEEIIRQRIDLDKMNKRVMYPVQEEQIESLVKNAQRVIEIFKDAEIENDIIIGSIG